jgi:hypothetical protein
MQLRTMHRMAIHGERFSDRVSANAVGRRGRFPEGRFPPNFCYEAPLGNAPSGGAARATPKAGVGGWVWDRGRVSNQRLLAATGAGGDLTLSLLRPADSKPGLLVRPSCAPASSSLRARSEVSGAITTRARRKDERRPSALAEIRSQTAGPWGARSGILRNDADFGEYRMKKA